MDEFVQTNEKVAAIIKKNFLIMKVNYSDKNKNKDFLQQYPEVPAYPHYFVLDSNGDFLHSQGTGELEKEKSYDEGVFTTFLNNWIEKTPKPTAKEPDLSRLERTILKEPDYAARPGYCLLAFGSNAETRVWLVSI